MAITKWKLNKYEGLFNDELIQESIEELGNTRQKLADWIKENKGREACPVCNNRNIRYSYNKITCNDCGWHKKIKVPYKGKVSLSRNLTSIIKQRFGRKIANKKTKEKINENDTKHMPIDLYSFDTGEYTDQQKDYLNNRFKEILETKDVEFNKKDIAIVHYLVLQEMKVKDLFRKEAVNSSKALNKDFASIKKDELKLYSTLKDDLEEIIERQKTSEKELSVYEKVNNEFESNDIQGMISELEEKRKEEYQEIEKSQERREKIKAGNYDLEDEIEEVMGDEDGK